MLQNFSHTQGTVFHSSACISSSESFFKNCSAHFCGKSPSSGDCPPQIAIPLSVGLKKSHEVKTDLHLRRPEFLRLPAGFSKPLRLTKTREFADHILKISRSLCCAALTGRTPSRYLLGASCLGCNGRQLPVCRLHRAPVARYHLSYVDRVHFQSACLAPVALWSGALPPQAYATMRSIPRLGALPGLRRGRKLTRCQHHFASIYAICTPGLTPRLECILPVILFSEVHTGGAGMVKGTDGAGIVKREKRNGVYRECSFRGEGIGWGSETLKRVVALRRASKIMLGV